MFKAVSDAVDAAGRSQQQLIRAGMEARDGICRLIKQNTMQNAQEWGRLELAETKVGRLDHKIAKLNLLSKVPGVEFLKSIAHSGDNGIGLDEPAPWGVIGVVTPVTHSIPTLSANAINMIAAGNAMVVNAHPSGYRCAAVAVRTYNQAIARQYGIENLICMIDPPTLESANAIFEHRDISLLVITGGPAVARAAMAQKKRAIVGGPGNPPVVVDQTADLDRAARSIIAGGGFDNNLLCIGEKEVFVVESVFDGMMAAMAKAGAHRLDAAQVDRLAKAAFAWKDNHHTVNKDLVGKDCTVLATAAGTTCPPGTDLLYGQTDEGNPFVPEEQMMPFVPMVSVANVDEAIALALKHEHGFGHTAVIHSNDLATITRMGRAMNTTLFAVNGPSTACLGIGGEGYPSYTVATPTGEGVTNPLTFTRFRRLSISGSLRMV
ncbi:MAG: aldehyde dehydrogenase [Phycisphaerae bacterium]|nr:aldehyde dehydrogenase [Phycisphaerae bacterium]